MIIGTIAFSIMLPHPLLYLLAVMFIGARQHALLILLHDGAHHRLAKSSLRNDLIAELFLAWPFVIVHMRNYRSSHFEHHRFLNTEKDPDWVWKREAKWPRFKWISKLLRTKNNTKSSNNGSLWDFPTSPKKLGYLLLSNLFFYGFWTALRRNNNSAKRQKSALDKQFQLMWAAYQVCVFTVLYTQGWLGYYLLFWVIPMVTWLQLCMLIRNIAEHFSINPSRVLYGETRTTVPNWIDKTFLVPRNIGFHIEHHLHPSIPYYHLPKCHAEYMKLSHFSNFSHVTEGYWKTLKECTTRKSVQQRRIKKI